MSEMSNAQVALVAATNSGHRSTDAVLELASEYLAWLAAQDNAGPGRNKPFTEQCHSISRGNSRCDGISVDGRPHSGKHYNARHGTAWTDEPGISVTDKPDTVKVPVNRLTPVHFGASGAPMTACGLERAYYPHLKYAADFDGITCENCRLGLGL